MSQIKYFASNKPIEPHGPLLPRAKETNDTRFLARESSAWRTILPASSKRWQRKRA
jgi:hypothetical protein